MINKSIYIGRKEVFMDEKKVDGELIQFENESYYKISNYDLMRPFFMSIVSDSNHWMFISSRGGLTAGRKDSESALFPYYSDDKITEASDITGSKTIFQVHVNDKILLWEPFSDRYIGTYKTQRNLYKNSFGNKIIYEEINHSLGLTFRYQWNFSHTYGFVKKSILINNNSDEISVTLLDGIQNIMPYGVEEGLQAIRSNLVDAYKKNELESEVGIGVFSLSAIIVDRAEPSEALKASVVWSYGLEDVTYLVSSLQVADFRIGKSIVQENDIRAEKGAYFVSTSIVLSSDRQKTWMIVADVNQTINSIVHTSELIKSKKDIFELVQEDIALGTKQLFCLNASSDALQMTADKMRNGRHFSNTLFNIMRGGVFDDNYQIEKSDFINYISKANKDVLKRNGQLLNALSEYFTLNQLKELLEKEQDLDLKRLAFEYMPLKFSRRHGDPSRPWNKFSINTYNEVDDSKILDYEGNWRDIFQNWEALAHSYPEFIENMIHKFLNATTFDGYNPYKVTKDGFDWETIEPDDPWSYIGYWGDHQIIYLLKFLEFIEDHYPNKLSSYFNQDIFVFANIPYKIKSYKDILSNPKDTIDFDVSLDKRIRKEQKIIGGDGALLKDKNNEVYNVNLIEKLLVTTLTKVSNFIPEGGIWMNTQRPEWNDANNALVGNGVSMVTLYYLRRFLNFFDKTVQNASEDQYSVSLELALFLERVLETFTSNTNILISRISNRERKIIVDGLGNAADNYRSGIYKSGHSNVKEVISKERLLSFIEVTLEYLNHTIKANKRTDNLYHSYNLMTVENDDEVSISHLPLMLEGQVAILSSGFISATSSLELLDGLKNSVLFRPDQCSYILYPDKKLPRFTERNNLPVEKLATSILLHRLLEEGNIEIIEKDILGQVHFNGSFNNAESLKTALSQLSKEEFGDILNKEEKLVLEIFEDVFNHKAFTGRSGTFYGYEGLGSIYWHMVSKLLLSVQETCFDAISSNENEEVVVRLFEHYYEIHEGIGVYKSPELYGAFPTDPYSHTPGGKGAQQPGLTGQVKEDILSRFGELGVFVKHGQLQFNPKMLRKEEFLKESRTFHYVDVNKQLKKIELEQNSLCFTYCQTPVIYQLASKGGIGLYYSDRAPMYFDSLQLDTRISAQIFRRTGEIEVIIVSLQEN